MKSNIETNIRKMHSRSGKIADYPWVLTLLIIVFSAVFSTTAISKDIMTLEEAVKITLANNYSVIMSKKSAEIADNNRGAGNAGMLPKLDITAGYQYNNKDIDLELAGGNRIKQDGNTDRAYNYAAQLSWTLFDGMAMFITYDKNEALKEKSDIELQVAMENSLRNLYSAYFESARLRQEINVLKSSLQISRNRLQKTLDKAEFGNAPKIETLQAKVDLNADSSQYLQTELAYKNSIRNLNFIMGRDVLLEFEPDTSVTFITLFTLKEMKILAMQANTSINSAIKTKEISAFDRQLILSAIYPRINANASWSFNKSEADAGYMLSNQSSGLGVGLNLSWNIFDGLKTNTAAENARLLEEINETTYQQLISQVDMSMTNAYDTWKRRMKIYRLEEDNLEAAELNFQRSEELYKLGRLSSIELREAQLNLVRSQNRILNARYQAKISETELLLLSGQMMKLGL